MQIDPYLKQFLDTTIDGAFLTDEKGTILFVNQQAYRMFGYAEGELIGQNIKMLTPSDIRVEHDAYLEKFDSNKGVSHVLGAARHLQAERRDGSQFPIEVGVSHFAKEDQRFFVGLIRDQSERISALKKISFLANYDSLTKLSNRSHFLNQIEARKQQFVGVLELVGFKALSLRMGHQLTDALLVAVARRIETITHEGLLLARVEHASFAMSVPGTCDPHTVYEDIKQAFETPFDVGDQKLHVNFNLGIASDADEEKTALDLLSQAELALSQVRDNPEEAVFVFDARLLEEQLRHDEMAKEIPLALEAGEFSLVFQPKLCRTDRHIVGAEVLIRWPNSKFGFVSPGEFIPVAEQHGLVSLLDGWVFKEAVAYLKELTERGFEDLELAVNLSALNLHDPDICEKMKLVFETHGLACHRIQIELTESALLEDSNSTLQMLNEIGNMGCPVAVDDFGTGYSSLSYLAQMPLTYLKVDQSFVRNIPEDPKAETIARSIITMAHSLGLKTIVEGVETQQQVTFMEHEKADIFQGYYFSKPLDKAAFEKFLEDHKG